MPVRLNNEFKLKDSGYSNYEDTVHLARHRWYYYKEGFSPKLVDQAIDEVNLKKGDVVIDPFNGSGTTTLAASIKGYKSIGIEVNPFTSFLSDAKLKNTSSVEIDQWSSKLMSSAEKTAPSNLIGFSTFSRNKHLEKWLFNDSVLNAFEGGWQKTGEIPGYHLKKLLRLSLIMSAMDNCNATRDGKCLRYRLSWKDRKFDKSTFIESLANNIRFIKQDIEAQPIIEKATIINGDAREQLHSTKSFDKFKLCITSPPYLNTFDYTDIYRPELFLGKFVVNNQQLYNLRLQTVRSHIQASWNRPTQKDFGIIYDHAISHLNENKQHLMHKNIPIMVQAYFEDMLRILKSLKNRAERNAELWIVVSNSAYANMEIPVDLIIGDLGTKAGWYLKEIGVLRHIQRRKTKHSPDIHQLRESVIILRADK